MSNQNSNELPITLPMIQAEKTGEPNRCIGCVFTLKDFQTSMALRTLLASEGCDNDCPILKAATPQN